jgi:hypothetical protein
MKRKKVVNQKMRYYYEDYEYNQFLEGNTEI